MQKYNIILDLSRGKQVFYKFLTMTDAEKLVQLQSYLRLSWKEIAQRIGIKTSQTFTDIRRGRHGISPKVAQAILRAFPQISRDWLIFGTGDMLAANKEQSVPLYGNLNDFESKVSNASYNTSHLFPNAEFAIRCVDNSMIEFPIGSTLFLKQVNNLSNIVMGSIYLVETEDFCAIKHIQKGSTRDSITLYSSNNKTYSDGRQVYEPFEIKIANIKRVFIVLGYACRLEGSIE